MINSNQWKIICFVCFLQYFLMKFKSNQINREQVGLVYFLKKKKKQVSLVWFNHIDIFKNLI